MIGIGVVGFVFVIVGLAQAFAQATPGDAATTSPAIGGLSPSESPAAVLYVCREEGGADLRDLVTGLAERLDRLERALSDVELSGSLIEQLLAGIYKELRALHWQLGQPPDALLLSQWRTIYEDWTGPDGTGVDPDGGDLDGDGDADLQDVWLWSPQRDRR